MNDELKEIINKLNELRREHERDKYNTYGYILFGWVLAMLGLSLSSPHLPDSVLFLIFATVFFVWGWVMRRRARRVKVE
jgi:Flp pilus assembly protein TadB